MPYPDKLLPKTEYKEELSINELLIVSEEYFLIRISSSPIQDPSNIKIREICKQTKDFVGLSTNLLGVFEVVHLPLKPLHRPTPDYWIKLDGSIRSEEINYEEIENRNPIFIRVRDLHEIPIPASKQVEQNTITIHFKVYIRHKPIKPNYWHFEATMLNTHDNQEVNRDQLPDWLKNAIKVFLEIDICHKASGILPGEFQVISEELYIENTPA